MGTLYLNPINTMIKTILPLLVASLLLLVTLLYSVTENHFFQIFIYCPVKMILHHLYTGTRIKHFLN